MHRASITHPDCRGIRMPDRKREATDGIDLAIRGCCGCIWPRRLCQWHVPYVLYITISTECPVTADYIERPVPLPVKPDRRRSRLSSISPRMKRFFLSGERKRPYHLRPVKKSRFQVALWKSHRISSQWLKKESFDVSAATGEVLEHLVYHNWYVNRVLWAQFYFKNKRERERLFSIGENTMPI